MRKNLHIIRHITASNVVNKMNKLTRILVGVYKQNVTRVMPLTSVVHLCIMCGHYYSVFGRAQTTHMIRAPKLSVICTPTIV